MNLHTKLPPIPFIDVAAQRRRLGPAIDAAVARVLDHCQFILGPEVKAFETELAAFCGAKHVVTCASGTDALVLALAGDGNWTGRCGDMPVLYLLCDRGSRGFGRRNAGVCRRRRRRRSILMQKVLQGLLPLQNKRA